MMKQDLIKKAIGEEVKEAIRLENRFWKFLKEATNEEKAEMLRLIIGTVLSTVADYYYAERKPDVMREVVYLFGCCEWWINQVEFFQKLKQEMGER